jgi:hypothetical protein
MRCYFCNKKIDKEDAYKFTWFSLNKKLHIQYYCNKEECDEYYKNKRYRRLLVKEIGSILGDTRYVSCIVDKRIDDLNELGYSYEDMLKIIKTRKRHLDLTNIEHESDRIKFIFDKIEEHLK